MTAPTPDTDVAYAAGAEAMREACADYIRTLQVGPGFLTTAIGEVLAREVARLPLPPAPESTS